MIPYTGPKEAVNSSPRHFYPNLVGKINCTFILKIKHISNLYIVKFCFCSNMYVGSRTKKTFFLLIYISPDYQFLLRIFSLWFWELEKLKSTMLKINIKQISCWVLFERPWDVPTSRHIFDSYAPFHKINIWSIFYCSPVI